MEIKFSVSSSTLSSSPGQSQGASIGESTAQHLASTIKNAQDAADKQQQGVKLSVGEEHLIKTIDRALKSLQGPETTLDISIHEKTHEIMVKVLNKDTGEVIREVPPERTLDLVASMMEIAGILIDEKA
ncbi:flagellar protein FlaG [Paenibacillus lemnae]|uniref:Flagellar protein FlaG n=1 Tax=Paenibacillus lemnae TaxID=1330551 RepID=A0A848M8T3_PAELE|nr:flagellar protein FlaG [Paenibacillus lemnae]NMO96621.1 flagellar protein FlaG [Paenibacillus lemnae]